MTRSKIRTMQLNTKMSETTAKPTCIKRPDKRQSFTKAPRIGTYAVHLLNARKERSSRAIVPTRDEQTKADSEQMEMGFPSLLIRAVYRRNDLGCGRTRFALRVMRADRILRAASLRRVLFELYDFCSG